MPAIRLGESPKPSLSRPPRHVDLIAAATASWRYSAPARDPMSSRHASTEDASFDDAIDLLISQRSRLANQDAAPSLKYQQLQFKSKPKPKPKPKPVDMEPPKPIKVPHRRRTPAPRPARPSPETLALTQIFLHPKLTQSRCSSATTPNLRPKSHLSESSEKEQDPQVTRGFEVPTGSPGRGYCRSTRKPEKEKKSVSHLGLSLQDQSAKTPKHMSDSTLDSAATNRNDISEDFSKPSSALSHWVNNAAWPPWSPRSRAVSAAAEVDTTDPSEPPSERPGSASKGVRRLFRPSDASSLPSALDCKESSSKRGILRSLGMTFDNHSWSSDSSWSSFGCVDGMRRPDLEEIAAVGGGMEEPNGKENVEAMPSTPGKKSGKENDGATPSTPGKKSWSKATGRKMLRKKTG